MWMEFSMWLKENLFEVGTFYLLLRVDQLLSNKCTFKLISTVATGYVPPFPSCVHCSSSAVRMCRAEHLLQAPSSCWFPVAGHQGVTAW